MTYFLCNKCGLYNGECKFKPFPIACFCFFVLFYLPDVDGVLCAVIASCLYRNFLLKAGGKDVSALLMQCLCICDAHTASQVQRRTVECGAERA